jgi:catalase
MPRGTGRESRATEPTMFVTNTGAQHVHHQIHQCHPVADNTNVMTAGPHGPALPQDIWLIEI